MSTPTVDCIPIYLPSYLALFLIIHKEHKAKLEVGDRVTIIGTELEHLSPGLGNVALVNTRIILCYEEEHAAFVAKVYSLMPDHEAVMRYITRNWPEVKTDQANLDPKSFFVRPTSNEVC